MVTERDAQAIYENQAEPDPDERSWREIPPAKPLEGEDLYDCLVELMKEGER